MRVENAITYVPQSYETTVHSRKETPYTSENEQDTDSQKDDFVTHGEEAQPEASNRKKNDASGKTITVNIETKDGTFQAEIPANGKAKIKLPKTKSSMQLRNRDGLKPPERFQANLANCHDEPQTVQEALDSAEREEWMKAMEEEMQSHRENGTWQLVSKPEYRKILHSKWVFKAKRNEDGSINRYKARLVVKGFEQKEGIDFNETFSSVCRYESIRLLVAIVAADNLEMMQFDIKTAFLYGELEEEIYMQQPEGFETQDNLACLLLKSLYGLRQAPRVWNNTFKKFLQDNNFEASTSDPSVFIGYNGNDKVYLALYVDDGLLIARMKTTLTEILRQMQRVFDTKVSEVETFVGINVQRDDDGGIFLGQKGFINSLLIKFNMQDCNQASVPMQPNLDLSPAENIETEYPFRQLIGSLLFLSRTTRPDIAFAVARLSQFTTCFDERHWTYGKHVLRYLKGTQDYGLYYGPDQTTIILTGYTDSDYAGDRNDRKSTSGYVFFLNEAPISWRSCKQDGISLSTTEAEYKALSSGAKEAAWIRRLVEELGYEQPEPTEIFVDNQSAIRLSKNPEFHNRSKHIEVRFHHVRNLIEEKQIDVSYVPTENQLADGLTKPLMREKFQTMRDKIGVKPRRQDSSSTSSLFARTMMLLAFLGTIQSGIAVHMQNSIPVLWKKGETPIASGYLQVSLNIKFLNPCSLLTEEIIHADLLKEAIEKCNEMYEDCFVTEIGEICPKKQWTEVLLHRKKRFLPLVILGGIILYHAVVAGLAITATVMSSQNAVSIAEMKANHKIEKLNREKLEDQVKIQGEMIKDIQLRFNQTISRLMVHQKDYNELKDKSISTSFAISYITSRLLNGKSIIKEAARAWQDKKVYGPFLDHLNITFPCEKECPVKYAKAMKCELSPANNMLYMDIAVPLINQNAILIEADPFRLMLRKNNQTCSVKYNGPENVILSLKDHCIYPVDVRHSIKEDILIAPDHGQCADTSSISDNTKYFMVEHCVDQHPHDERDYVQVKLNDDAYHIYCPESEITIDERTQKCPSYVFMLPINSKFKINGVNFVSSKVTLEHSETWDPILTMRANYHLRPTVNWDDLLLGEGDMVPDFPRSHSELEHITSYGFWAFILAVLILVVVAAVGVGMIVKWKRSRVITVEAHAMESIKPSAPVEVSPD
ncbi:unnamed protein product [Orchesella dallaii]|uniref:Reverse transcriptase Ty1/copia-type domain-containing protein n=1 Tax=Orchesella dallaii TaxID=48710 RepID=A0ABP1QAP1_9HEXA